MEFHERLDALNDQFIAVANDVAQSMPAACQSFLEGDLDVIDETRGRAIRVGQQLEQVEEDCFVQLALEAPVGGDLRRLVALLRVTSNVDRAASLVTHACGTLERYDIRQLPEDMIQQLSELSRRAADVFQRGVSAWRGQDALAVIEIDDADLAVDRLRDDLVDIASRDRAPSEALLVLGLLARYFERIADHGVAIARDAAFVATGERVKTGKRRQAANGGGD